MPCEHSSHSHRAFASRALAALLFWFQRCRSAQASSRPKRVRYLLHLILTRQTAATVGDDGVRVLSEGTTLGTLATFSDNVLELLLEGGEDGQLLGAVFGLEAGSEEETETSRILVRRIDPRRYFPDGEIGRFFRYRPWG